MARRGARRPPALQMSDEFAFVDCKKATIPIAVMRSDISRGHTPHIEIFYIAALRRPFRCRCRYCNRRNARRRFSKRRAL
ncbi:hypothetical protein BVI1335_530110 [Burkholderia vietnamiensis]|nr:hypothetical protein BVI1335_530110 [Burkholderia vietnamiensis]